MRILHLSSLYPPQSFGGAEKVVEVLAEGMAGCGLTVAAAHQVRDPVRKPPPDAGGTPCRHGVQVHPLRHRNPLWIEDSARWPGPVRNLNKLATLFNVVTAHDFGRVLDEFRPDIVHSHSMSDLTTLMWASAARRRLPIVHTLHDYDLLCIRGSLYKDGRRCEPRHTACAAFSAVKRRHHRAVSSVVGVSTSILQTHLDHGFFDHLPPERRRTIWNPLRQSAPVGTGAAPAGRPARDPARPLTFGFLGRLVPEKGIQVLLQACRSLPAEGWRLRVGGRAPGGIAALEAAAAGLPVQFEGFVDPQAFLAGIDVLVVPSVWLEPFGLTIVEAYAAGVRVIGACSGGVAEIVGAVDPDGLVAPDDAPALAKRMRDWMQPGTPAQPQAEALQQALARIRPEQVVAQYLGVYEDALLSRRKLPADVVQTGLARLS